MNAIPRAKSATRPEAAAPKSLLEVIEKTLDAARGSDGPFDPRIHAVRGQSGQIECAAAYRALEAIEPVYEMLPGWRISTRGIDVPIRR